MPSSTTTGGSATLIGTWSSSLASPTTVVALLHDSNACIIVREVGVLVVHIVEFFSLHFGSFRFCSFNLQQEKSAVIGHGWMQGSKKLFAVTQEKVDAETTDDAVAAQDREGGVSNRRGCVSGDLAILRKSWGK